MNHKVKALGDFVITHITNDIFIGSGGRMQKGHAYIVENLLTLRLRSEEDFDKIIEVIKASKEEFAALSQEPENSENAQDLG